MKLFLFLFFNWAALTLNAAEAPNLIFVNGMAEQTIEPNMVVVRLDSWAKDSSAKKAQEQQATQYLKVKRSLEKFKIKKEDIQTESYSVSPEYFYDQKNQTNKIVAYRVNHTILVTYRNVEDAGNFIDELIISKTDKSAVNVSNISWDSDKKNQVEVAALGEAVKNARVKADKLADAAGVKIKATHKIQHISYSSPPSQPYFEKAMVMEARSVAPSTELSGGQIKVRVEVQMEFEI